MLFDWFTIFAQLFNFLLLIWLLKRFLYKPILQTIDEREKRIATQIQDAEAKKADAIKELENFQFKNKEFEQQRQSLLNTAVNEVNEERQHHLEEARKEVELLCLRLQETLEAEQQNLSSEIMQRTRTEVFAIVRKALKELASSSLEEQITAVFINRFKELNYNEKGLLMAALKSTSNVVVVRSAFELTKNLQTAIKTAINLNFSVEPEFKFETTPNLVSGIELVAGGYKVVWNIDDYLGSLEAAISDILKEKTLGSTKVLL